MRLISCLIVSAVLAVLPAPASAQQGSASSASRKLIISEHAIAEGLARASAANPSTRDNGLRTSAVPGDDSLKNGAIIGAVVGGVGMAIFTTFLCNALQEPGDPPCWRGVLAVSSLFAGIGAAAGAGIDALAMQAPSTKESFSRRPPQ